MSNNLSNQKYLHFNIVPETYSYSNLLSIFFFIRWYKFPGEILPSLTFIGWKEQWSHKHSLLSIRTRLFPYFIICYDSKWSYRFIDIIFLDFRISQPTIRLIFTWTGFSLFSISVSNSSFNNEIPSCITFHMFSSFQNLPWNLKFGYSVRNFLIYLETDFSLQHKYVLDVRMYLIPIILTQSYPTHSLKKIPFFVHFAW